MDKEKFQLEILFRSATRVLYNSISTPSGLSEWFADNVNIKNDLFIFIWDDSEETARLLSKKSGEFVRFQWLEDEGTDYFFEIRIKTDPMTKEVALYITDFAEPDEKEESMQLWESQVDQLKRILGG
ncbi:MAG: START-like domain-containing protein [Salibacteraceae bacterium]